MGGADDELGQQAGQLGPLAFAERGQRPRAGFHEYVETERMFFDIFTEFRKRKVIP